MKLYEQLFTSALAATSIESHIKRSSACTQNSTYNTTPTSSFSISCNSIWAWWDALYITFTPDFESCMNACATWNSQGPKTCLGVSWADGTYGPSGATGGSECIFYWSTSTSFQSNGTDSSQLDTVETPTTTSSVSSTLPTSQPTPTECASQNATGYVTTGGKFDLFCDTNWAGNDLYIDFVSDFDGCMDLCAQWNENVADTCVGVAFSTENYGPGGLADGTQCWFKWSMPDGQSAPFVGLDNARLEVTATSSIHVATTVVGGTQTSMISTSTSSVASTGTTAHNTDVSNTPHSTGAIVGGIVGGVIAFAIALLVAIIFFRRRRTGTIQTEEMSSGQLNSARVQSEDTGVRLSRMLNVRLKYLDGDVNEMRELPSARLERDV